MTARQNGVDTMEIELEDEIDEGHPSGLCPLCDNPIFDHEPATVVTAHGVKHLVHSFCLEDLDDDAEGEANEVQPAEKQK